jgi:hypothetical protein
MAIRIISGCTSSQTYVVDFNSFPVIGNNVYQLSFYCPSCDSNEVPPTGCYTVLSLKSEDQNQKIRIRMQH